MSEYLTAHELSEWLKLSVAAAYQIEPGRVRIGRCVRWDRAKVQAWLDGP